MSLTKATYSMIVGAPINVKDYGAKGDGVDDRVAVQAAYAAARDAGGGTLYFPAGTYAINLLGDGNDKVSLVGEGPSSALKSYANNDWAVKIDGQFQDGNISIENLSFSDSTGAKTRHGLYVNTASGFSLRSVNFSGLGIGFCNNATWGFSFDSCKSNNNYVDFFTTCSTGANTSITNINGQTVQITDAFFPQHAGIMLFKNCYFGGRVGHYFEQPDNPFAKEAALQYLNCVSVPAGGCGFYYNQAGWQHTITMTQMWMEGSLAATPVRALTLPARYVYANSNTTIAINDSFLGPIEIANDVICSITNCVLNDNSGLTSTDRASFIGKNLIGNGLGGVNLPFFVESARNIGSTARGPYFHTSPKTNINRAYSGQKLSSNRCFAADPLFASFGGTQTRSTTDSAFETLQCIEVSAVNNNGVIPFGTVTLDNTKVYVVTMAVKAVGATFTLSLGTSFCYAIVQPPLDRFQTYALVGSPVASGADQPLMLNASAGTQVWRISGVQYLQFDTYSQAYEFLASSSFTL